jgi:DNA polymerase III delta prime subunit
MTENPENETNTEMGGIKHLKYNVIYPSDEEDYIPMYELGKMNDIPLNEIDIIIRAVERDKRNPRKHVTVIYLMGPPGLGKTTLGSYLAREYNCPYQVINCVGTMTDLDMIGSWVLIKNETQWQDGPLPSIVLAANDDAKESEDHVCNGILIVNELNALQMNAQLALNPLMDRQESVVLTLCNNTVMKVNRDAHLLILASMNPDIMGVNDLQGAVRDRPSAIILFTYPPPEKEALLISKKLGVKKELVMKFVEVINECRALKTTNQTISEAPSTRAILNWIEYTEVWGVETAFELTVVNKYGKNDEERDVLRGIGIGKKIKEIMLPTKYSPTPMASRRYAPPKEKTKATKKKNSSKATKKGKNTFSDVKWKK